MPDTPSSLESLDKAISDFLESLHPLLQVVAFASIPGSAEAFRQAFEDWELYFQEQDKFLLAFTIKHGLIGVERHFTSEQLCLLVRWTVEQGNDVVNRRLPEFVTLKQIQEIVSGWERIPYLKSRKKVCEEVVEAYRMGLHTLVVPALLPLAEGLASDIVPDPCRTDAVVLASKAQITHSASDANFGAATIEILERSYYGREDFSLPATPERFNRHRILHGRSPDYGTAANSIRAFLLVDTVADMWGRLSSNATAP